MSLDSRFRLDLIDETNEVYDLQTQSSDPRPLEEQYSMGLKQREKVNKLTTVD